MAETADGEVIDPFDGQKDLKRKVLRHVSPAFAEDPLRVLRLARFAALFPDFTVADDTALLLQHLVRSGELENLTRERVWLEVKRLVVMRAVIDFLPCWPSIMLG